MDEIHEPVNEERPVLSPAIHMASVKVEVPEDQEAEATETVENDTSDHNKPDHKSEKLTSIMNTVDDKTNLLSQVWNELYCLLSEYKAELHTERLTLKYDTSDVSELRNELVEKDNEITNLRNQLEEFQRRSEQCQIDLSVKDGLLKKYQEDLLQKEASLLTSASKMSRLENRLKALEGRTLGEDSQRKLMRPPMLRTFNKPGGLMSRPGLVRSPIGGRIPGLRTVPPVSPIRRSFSPSVKLHPVQKPTDPIPTKPETSTPSNNSSEPIVCIEVDDDEMKEVEDVTQALETQPEPPSNSNVYMSGWSEQDNAQTDDQNESTEGLEDCVSMDGSAQPGFSGNVSASSLDTSSLQGGSWPSPVAGVLTHQALQQHHGVQNKTSEELETELIRGVLRSKGRMISRTFLQQSGPKIFSRTSAVNIQAIFTMLEAMRLGRTLRRGMFEKVHPDHVSVNLLAAYGVHIQDYRRSYERPISNTVRTLMNVEGLN